MSVMKIGMIGVLGVLLALQFKSEKDRIWALYRSHDLSFDLLVLYGTDGASGGKSGGTFPIP